MPRNRPMPADIPELVETNRYRRFGQGRNAPLTPIQALMEARPFEDPAESFIEQLPLRDKVLEAMEVLDEREAWVIRGLFWGRMTLRQMGRELALSKTQVARIRDGAMEKLSVALVHLVDGMDA